MKSSNCNLELRLFPPCDSSHCPIMEEASDQSSQQQYQQHRPLTIFYDGKIWACDVTELQARFILMLSNREMEKRVSTASGSKPCSPTILKSPHQLYSPGNGTGLSMKQSLQRFLQKRKNRIQEASPYHH